MTSEAIPMVAWLIAYGHLTGKHLLTDDGLAVHKMQLNPLSRFTQTSVHDGEHHDRQLTVKSSPFSQTLFRPEPVQRPEPMPILDRFTTHEPVHSTASAAHAEPDHD